MARASTAAAASRRKPRAAARRGALAATDRPALLLLVAWIAYRLHPYVPVLSLEKYWHAIRPVLQDPLPHGSDPFRLCLMWLLCCMLIEAAAGAARTGRLFAIFAGGIFAAKVLIADNGLSSADIAGACVALVLWLLFFRRAPARHAILALFFAAMIAALRLAPSAPHGFGWQVLAEKAFLYGGLIWLLNRAGMRLLHATLATALLLLLTSVGAAHGVVRSAWIGVDAAEALAAGALLYAVGLSLPHLSRP